MIEHVYRRAADARGIDAVVVATDDERVARAVARFGGVSRMTHPHHRTGMDRIAEVARDLHCSIVVNVQGDEPLVDSSAISLMIDALKDDPDLPMSTLRTPIRREEDYASPHVVKVVVNGDGDALYFSRAPIPFYRDKPAEAALDDRHVESAARQMESAARQMESAARHVESGFSRIAFKHLGLYAYRREFLLRLAALPQTALEQAESLEQLRALEHGHRIRAVETQHDSIGVDTPEDLERVRQTFGARGFRVKAEATDTAEATGAAKAR
jgi:3-deoxy-manno-octulosonate cytidylyltransferase (CMP-KDO synthetase)